MKRILMAIVTAILMGSGVPVMGNMVPVLLPVSDGSAAYASRHGGGIPGLPTFPTDPCKCG